MLQKNHLCDQYLAEASDAMGGQNFVVAGIKTLLNKLSVAARCCKQGSTHCQVLIEICATDFEDYSVNLDLRGK